MNKTLILASFIFPDKIDWFTNYLEVNFNIKKNNLHFYEILGDKSKTIITFRLIIDKEKPLDLKKFFPSTITIHKKGDCLYTINALNRLISEKNPDTIGNIDNKKIIIDWSEYQNKFILTNNNELTILNISRIF